MRQTRTRILSLLLALVMCLGLLPMTALAAGEDANTSYTITFDANGGQFPDGSATMAVQTKWLGAGNNITTTPPDPIREDYIFDGWDIEFVWNHNFTSDATVYANWKKIDGEGTSGFTITFDANGGSVTPETAKTDANGKLQIPLPSATKPGYELMGWYDDGALVYDSTVYTKSTTLVAYWYKPYDPDKFGPRVDFFVNGGTIKSIRGFVPSQISPGYPLASDEGIFIESSGTNGMIMADASGRLDCFPEVVRNGYTFDGWYATTESLESLIGSGAGEFFTDFSGCEKVSLSTIYSEDTCLIARWTKNSDICTVTFDLNGATGTAPASQKVERGKTVNLPVLSAVNAKFLGWGYSMDGKTLTEWKAEYPVTSDLTLYAMWETSSEDTYSFSNSDSAFDSYRITDAYFDFLTEDVGSPWKDYMEADYYGEDVKWGGSCFGMSAVYCMARGMAIDLSVFQSGTTTLRGLKTPRQSQNIQDLINFYMMAQSTIAGTRGKNAYLNLEQTKRYEKIVSDLMAEKGFSVLGFQSIVGGHAIVARSIQQSSDGYHIEIWDPNNPEGLGELVISRNFSSARFTDETYGARSYNVGTMIKYIMPLSTRSQTYDAKNLQSVFGKGGSVSTHSSNTGLYLLSSSTGDFTVTSSDGRSAVVKGGTQVSGDLTLLDNTIDGSLSSGYRFCIETSDLEQVTIMLDGKESEFTFVSDTIMAKAAADTLSSIVIDGDKVTTTCTASAEQEIIVVSDKLGSTWNKVTVSGKDTRFTLSAESGQLRVSSKNNTAVTVQGENVDTRETSSKQTVTASSSGTAVVMSGLGTGTQQPAGDNPFTDVKEGAYYYDAVLWAVEKNVTSGTSATTFSPDNPCTRGQIVTFLWRAAGSPKPTSTQNPFTDVKSGAYYYDAVLWAVEKGITSGTSATTFSPDTACTRGQTVTFLWRAAGAPKAASDANPFTDVKTGAYYNDAVLWAVEQKVTSGTSATTFSPEATVTRGQTVTFLYRSQGI